MKKPQQMAAAGSHITPQCSNKWQVWKGRQEPGTQCKIQQCLVMGKAVTGRKGTGGEGGQWQKCTRNIIPRKNMCIRYTTAKGGEGESSTVGQNQWGPGTGAGGEGMAHKGNLQGV